MACFRVNFTFTLLPTVLIMSGKCNLHSDEEPTDKNIRGVMSIIKEVQV